jgi:hypothetical protein
MAVVPKGTDHDTFLKDASARFDWKAWNDQKASITKVRVGQQKQKKAKSFATCDFQRPRSGGAFRVCRYGFMTRRVRSARRASPATSVSGSFDRDSSNGAAAGAAAAEDQSQAEFLRFGRRRNRQREAARMGSFRTSSIR